MRVGLAVFWLVLLGTAAPALAAGDGGHGFALKEHGFYILNFVIFMGILVWMGRAPLRVLLAERSERFSRRLDAAREQFEATQARLTDARQRLDGLEGEKQSLLTRVEEEGTRLEQAIAQRTEVEEQKLRDGAKAALENETQRLEKAFQAELALASLERATRRLESEWRQLPQARFVASFTEELERLDSQAGGR
jgi:F0F1-type ATP synthase membrane subunit b/b'